MGRVREEKPRSEKSREEKRKSEKKEDPGAQKGRKVAIHPVFPMICGSGWSKSRLAKAAGAEPSGQMIKNCTPFGAKHISKQKVETPQLRSTFRSCDVKKVHAVVARSTFSSQNF